METDRVISIRRGLRWLIAVSLVASAGLLIWAAVAKASDGVRAQFLLTFAGLAVGSLLALIQVGAIHRSPRLVYVGTAAIAASQICYFLLVWSGLTRESLLWRLWWLTMVPSIASTHLMILRAATVGRSDLIERGTKICVYILGLLLFGFGLYRHLLHGLLPVHKWLIFLFAGLVLVGSLIIWRQWARGRAKPAPMPRGVRVAWICISYVVVLVAGWYLGRSSAPPPSVFDVLPSALAGVPPERINVQVRLDLDRLKILTVRMEELTQRAAVLDEQLTQRRAADGRTLYFPKEEDQIRCVFMSYLGIRTALLRLALTYAGFEAVHEPDLKARCFTVGYAAAMTVFKTSLKFVMTYEDSPMARAKLNEAELRWDIRAGMFDQIYGSVTSSRNLDLAAEMAAYFDSRRGRWREVNIWPNEDFGWLETLIDEGVEYVNEHRIGRTQAWIDRLMERVKSDAYTPAYAAQTMIARWIGDVRIVEQDPLITIAQIESIESMLKPGDILLERRNWSLSNAFLPGFWPHAALYVGGIDDLRRLGIVEEDAVKEKLEEYLKPASDGRNHTVIEAVSEGVIFNSLTESMHADHIAVLRPRVSKDQIAHAIVEAFRHQGKPYDFEFDFETSDKLVCTELVYRCYDGILNFDLITIAGRQTLPALEIVHKFAKERLQPNPELEFVLFLDGNRDTGKARRASPDDLCESTARPGIFSE